MNVTTLQNALNNLGADPKLKVSGIIDLETIHAIKAFQEKNKLEADGVVGPITGTTIAKHLSPNGIPVALAVVLDCTDWDMPVGGWHMPKNVANYRFFYQPSFPGGGYGAVKGFNEVLTCGHVYVPVDPAVLKWVTLAATNIRNGDPTGDYFALLIRGLTMGANSLSPLEPIQEIFDKLKIRTKIVSEGLFAHDNQASNEVTAFHEALGGAKIILVGHSMGGDEVVPIAQNLNREYVALR